MKRSKGFYSKKLIFFGLWGLLFAALFFAGLWSGFNPKLSFTSKTNVKLLAYDSKNLKESFLQDLEAATGYTIEVEVVPSLEDFESRLVTPEAPPLLWLPRDWARALAHQELLLPLKYMSDDLEKIIHPDFRFFNNTWMSIPLLWSIQNQSLEVECLAIALNSNDSRRGIKILRSWITPEIAVRQVQLGDSATTLLDLDRWDLPHTRKAQSFRDLSLAGLKEKLTITAPAEESH